MKESCCQFGENRRLVGIVSEPERGLGGPAWVLVSAGLLPKHGPYRLYAELTRRLATLGFVAMRFDLGGLGDSHPDYAGLSLEARTMREIEAAVDYVTLRYNRRDVVLAGLCSGAEDSFRYAERDPRVTGVVLVDPFAYRTPGFFLRDLTSRAVAKSVRWAQRLVSVLPNPSPPARRGASQIGRSRVTTSLIDYQHLSREEARRILRVLLSRRAQLHFVYTGGTRNFNHRHQFQAMFPELDLTGRVVVDHLARIDHTQILEEDRAKLVFAITHRLANGAPGPNGGGLGHAGSGGRGLHTERNNCH